MNVQIIFKDAKRSPATDEKVMEKVNKLSKYFMKWPHVKWNCSKEGNGYVVDVYIHDQQHHFHASVQHENMYKCFDDVTSKLEKQLNRYHAKMKSKMHLTCRYPQESYNSKKQAA